MSARRIIESARRFNALAYPKTSTLKSGLINFEGLRAGARLAGTRALHQQGFRIRLRHEVAGRGHQLRLPQCASRSGLRSSDDSVRVTGSGRAVFTERTVLVGAEAMRWDSRAGRRVAIPGC